MRLHRLAPWLLAVPALALGAEGAPRGAAAPAVDCTRCHDERGWSPARFDHDTTAFPLRDAHATVTCRGCHQDVHRLALESACTGCHQDVHAGRLGPNCDRCHDQKSFRTGAGVEAHGQTRFPLLGRHALTPCEKCHQARADRTFGGAPVDCVGCHAPDARRTAGAPLDHTPMGPEPACRRCHDALGWTPARFPDHDRCFPINAGAHRGLSCYGCHTSLQGLGVAACASFTASCTRCHAHACAKMDEEHREHNVLGYQCTDRKCYECHAAGRP